GRMDCRAHALGAEHRARCGKPELGEQQGDLPAAQALPDRRERLAELEDERLEGQRHWSDTADQLKTPYHCSQNTSKSRGGGVSPPLAMSAYPWPGFPLRIRGSGTCAWFTTPCTSMNHLPGTGLSTTTISTLFTLSSLVPFGVETPLVKSLP